MKVNQLDQPTVDFQQTTGRFITGDKTVYLEDISGKYSGAELQKAVILR
jgi:hypothetical protein